MYTRTLPVRILGSHRLDHSKASMADLLMSHKLHDHPTLDSNFQRDTIRTAMVAKSTKGPQHTANLRISTATLEINMERVFRIPALHKFRFRSNSTSIDQCSSLKQ